MGEPDTTASLDDIVQQIEQLVPPGAPPPADPALRSELERLTGMLIQVRGAEELQEDPFAEAYRRPIHLHESALRDLVAGKTVLVTGAAGMVGSHLIQRLLSCGVGRVLAVDSLRGISPTRHPLPANDDPRVRRHVLDVRDFEALDRLFAAERPQLVFHLAALLHPGKAELAIHETVAINVFGSQNIITLCERHGVERCIHASTGKAARYFTSDIYAATKKITEWQFAVAAAQGATGYSMVRFTHIAQNSPVSATLDCKLDTGIVSLHAPYRYLYIQNVGQAVHLLLNAAVLQERGRLKFFAVQDLGWPISLLDLALHKIVRSGRPVAIYFEGVPAGYEAHAFPGQFDFGCSAQFNAMVNVLEAQETTTDSSGDMVVGEMHPVAPDLLKQLITRLDELHRCGAGVPADQLKRFCAGMVATMTSRRFAETDPAVLINILKWGIEPRRLRAEGIELTQFRTEIELLARALYGRVTPDAIRRADPRPPSLRDIAALLEYFPDLQREQAYLQRCAGAAERSARAPSADGHVAGTFSSPLPALA